MMDGITEQLVAYSLSVRPEEVPEATVREARRKLVDAAACALGGLNGPPTVVARRLALRAPGTAGVLGSAQKALPELAAFANSVAIRHLDYNDTYPGCHPSDMLGAILAVGDAIEADGRRVLASMVAGYEVYCRLIDATWGKARGWDGGTFLAPAVACALSNLMGLPPEQAGYAIALATVESPALRQSRAGELTMWKGAATPNAARNGTFAALMAAEGMTGPAAPFEGRNGLFEQVSGPLDLDLPSPREGSPKMAATSLKYFPVDYNAQAAVWVARELRERVPFDQVEAISIRTYEHARNESAGGPERWDPRTKETADHSIPYVMACAWRDGTIDLGHFRLDCVLDPALRPFMASIAVNADPSFPNWRESVVMEADVRAKDGSKYHARIQDPKGLPANPMTDDDIKAKFRAMSDGVLASAEAEAVLAWLWRFEKAPSTRELFEHLGGARTEP